MGFNVGSFGQQVRDLFSYQPSGSFGNLNQMHQVPLAPIFVPMAYGVGNGFGHYTPMTATPSTYGEKNHSRVVRRVPHMILQASAPQAPPGGPPADNRQPTERPAPAQPAQDQPTQQPGSSYPGPYGYIPYQQVPMQVPMIPVVPAFMPFYFVPVFQPFWNVQSTLPEPFRMNWNEKDDPASRLRYDSLRSGRRFSTQMAFHFFGEDGTGYAIGEGRTFLGRLRDRIWGYRVYHFDNPYDVGTYIGVRTRNFAPTTNLFGMANIAAENVERALFERLNNERSVTQPAEIIPGFPPTTPDQRLDAPRAPRQPRGPFPLYASPYPFRFVGSDPAQVTVRVHPEWAPDENGNPILNAQPVEEPQDVNLFFQPMIPKERREIYV